MSERDGSGPFRHIREHADIIERDYAILQDAIRDGGLVLDVGAGPATFVRYARERGMHVSALDFDRDAAPYWAKEGVPGVLADGFHLPFGPATFDAVRMKEIIEHVQDPLALVRAAVAVLRPAGVLLAHVPSPYSQWYPAANFWDDYTHVRPLTKRGLERLVEDAGCTSVQVQGYVSGRNAVERAVGAVAGKVIPHTYRVVARRQ